MTGQQLFDKYTEQRDHGESQQNDYAQTLQTALMLFGDKVFAMLERAERDGKKIELIENLEVEGEPTDIKLV
jgi:hypothetical protein